eukprot:TRINITY_DN25994_c0_g1_i1.p1 TRINITY_DN25994_c0_g1~~TRINITY_DN25994_c0_g1_i1.p1  ORF type:complete len:561 (+),score=64.61 TRINITY_DN25994_c0_g1_i1:51-1685(+)
MALPIKFQGASVSMQQDATGKTLSTQQGARNEAVQVDMLAIEALLARSNREILESLDAKFESQQLLIEHLIDLTSRRVGASRSRKSSSARLLRQSDRHRSLNVLPYHQQATCAHLHQDSRPSYLQAKEKAEADLPDSEDSQETLERGPSSRRSTADANLASKISSSWQFLAFFGALIFFDALLIAVQVDLTAAQSDLASAPYFAYVQYAFVALFAGELFIHMVAEGLSFFYSSYWNYLDLLLVATSLIEIIFALVSGGDTDSSVASTSSQVENARVFRFLRLARLAQVARVTRMLYYLRPLRTLVFSIALTVRSLLWALVLIAVILFFFGCVFTESVSLYFKSLGEAEPISQHADVLKRCFGSLLQSMRTLFACALGGISWLEIADALEKSNWFMRIIFETYICFFCLAVLNVLTGTFCQSAIESAMLDKDMLVERLRQNKGFYIDALTKQFSIMDEDQDGAVNILEFEKHFDKGVVKDVYQALGLDSRDAWSLFSALDGDGDHVLDAHEFLEGCIRLRGHASSIEMENLRKELHKLKMYHNIS